MGFMAFKEANRDQNPFLTRKTNFIRKLAKYAGKVCPKSINFLSEVGQVLNSWRRLFKIV